MSIKNRRIFYIFLFFIFLICTPIAIYYTQGFRYNFKLNKFQKTGALFIRTNPAGANILLNGNNTSIASPNKISSLLPGNYQVKVEKNGYLPWKKNLEIKSTITTFAEDIYLFKNKFNPVLINSGEIITLLPTTSKNKIIYQNFSDNNYKIWIYYSTSQKSDFIMEIDTRIKFIAWSTNEEKILIFNEETGYAVISPNKQEKLLSLKTFTKFDLSNIAWDDQSDNLLWALANNRLKQVDLLNRQTKGLDAPNLMAILPTSEGHYFIYKNSENNKTFLAYAPEKKFENFLELGELPNDINYKIEKFNDWLFIYNFSYKQLYFLQLKNQKILFYNMLKDINGYELKDKYLLFWSDYEYWIYNIAENKNELIERLSSPIINVLWHPEANYLISEAEKKLKLIEIDNRDEKNIYPILNTQENIGKNITFSPDSESLIFADNINGLSGIYYISLQ